ncbi:DNA-binding transcriptional regulator, MerR family [Geodermatophilus siccatus]|uniref:DNA-binding transcriptional regulator, MerR family n=1 Tax=Geodermatophilus siccatus TaxID=1137991 RepID=A0A1G9XEE7_9ACTN|nr:MerR family transcriptional regulator [Geodermatophilus siccatus]SDM94911.1 DNA-binding transcriptional regulator, MerR family [Geodermatophilus siccatus]
MRIGELAGCTGVSTRMLRYYEEQHLVTPTRSANGYREYGEADVDRVRQVRALLDAGLPTRFVRAVLDMGLDGGPAAAGWTATCTATFATQLRGELVRLEDRLTCLARSRDAVRRYLATVTVVEAEPDGTAA